MKKPIILMACLLWYTALQAQSTQESQYMPGRNIIYGELMGNSGIYSINYERIFVIKPTFQFSARIGIGGFPVNFRGSQQNGVTYSDHLVSNLVIPMEGIFSFGKTKHKFEIGIGYTHMFSWGTRLEGGGMPFVTTRTYSDYQIGIVPSFAYRYQPADGGFFLRAGIAGALVFNTNPSASTLAVNFPIPLPKICIGYTIKSRKLKPAIQN